MAILIPSKNIYDKQNPKVRDNVIERIEVGAKEVVPDNEYEISVFNKNYIVQEKKENKETENYDFDYNATSFSSGGYEVSIVSYSYVAYDNQKIYKTKIEIPLLQKNKWIKDLFIGLDKQDNYNIKHTLFGVIEKGKCRALPTVDNIIDLEIYPPNETKEMQSFVFPKEIKNENKFDFGGSYLLTAEANQKLKDLGNLSTVNYDIQTINGIEYYILDIVVLCDIRVLKMGGGGYSNNTIYLEGDYEIYNSTELEITFYGNTIGIDLTDKTVYINGQTAKKVHSVDGNELMQTRNYIKDENENITENAIGTMYGKTRKKYERGKETATIRCSVGDYYDYDSGDKVISIDNSTDKMSFKMYDQVIPMVYGADGKDRPMSTYQDGSPKVFQVLGSNIYYDGAVWQELSLQELDKSKIMWYNAYEVS